MWLHDLVCGLRQIQRNPAFSGVIILLLAVGIGANTLIFSLVNTLLLKPLPVRNPDNLYLVEKMPERFLRPDPELNYRQLAAITAHSSQVAAAISEQFVSPSGLIPFGDNGPVRLVMTQIVSPNYFAELGISAAAGRVLTPQDASATSDIPVVISHQFWSSQFAGRADAVGKTIRLKDRPFLIVGVLPEQFHSIDIERAPDIRLPISASESITGHPVAWSDDFGSPGFQVLVRLQPGVHPEAAASALEATVKATEADAIRERSALAGRPLTPSLDAQLTRFRVRLQPVAQGVSQMRDQFSRALWLLLGGVGLLLVTVCANVAGLMLAKAERTSREIAVRVAVGAGRGRIARQILTEGVLLAVPGAVLGIALAFVFAPLMIRLLPPATDYSQLVSSRILTVTPDWRILAFAVMASVLSTLLFALAPAWRASSLEVYAELRGKSAHGGRTLLAHAPVALQVALSIVLLTAAALMIRTFRNLETLNPGFDRARVIEFNLWPKDTPPGGHGMGAFYHDLRDRVVGLPGVESAAYARRGLMRGTGMKTTVTAQGVTLPPKTFLNTSINWITPEYLRTLGIRLLAGRIPRPEERKQPPAPVLINKALSDLLFPNQDPVGKLLVSGTDGTKPPESMVAGVVETAKYRSMREADPPTYYIVVDEATQSDEALRLYVLTSGPPESIAGGVRAEIASLDRSVPLMEVSTLEEQVRNSLWQERLVALLASFFAFVALLLTGVGLYGALSYSVTRRARELGIRMAIGARWRHIATTASAGLAWAVGAGLAAGALLAAFVAGFTRSLLYGVSPFDGASFALAGGFVIACAVLAALPPVLRALRIDPAQSLRAE
ncbi:MAG: ABC transporter permease [Bryobacteraceae bacterium]